MIQRHTTTRLPNAAYRGPRDEGAPVAADKLVGQQTRTVVLDTCGPRWKAYFLAHEELVGECEMDKPPEQIGYVAISMFPNTVACFSKVSLRAMRISR